MELCALNEADISREMGRSPRRLLLVLSKAKRLIVREYSTDALVPFAPELARWEVGSRISAGDVGVSFGDGSCAGAMSTLRSVVDLNTFQSEIPLRLLIQSKWLRPN